MQLHDYLRILRRWALLAFVLAIACAAGAYALTKYAIHPLYQATVTMEVQLGLATQSSPDPTAEAQYAATAAAVANQASVMSQAVQQANRKLPPAITRGGVNNISCDTRGPTSLFSCTATARDPVYAATVANNLAAAFINGEANWQSSRYQQVLARLTQEEASARNSHDTTRYDSLVQLETNVRLAAAQRASIARVVTSATAPASPSSPHPPLNAALAFALVLILVLGAGTLADRLDDSIRSEDELTSFTGLPVLGMIPYIRTLKTKNPDEKTVMVVGGSHPRTPVAEAFRATRTGIAFSGINTPWQTLLIASPLPSEGKSTIALNVAAALAEAGKSVILIDLDLWHRSISRIFHAPNAGLTNLLLQPYQDPKVYLRPTPEHNLSILPSGPLPPNPAELIGSPAMADVMNRLRGCADLIIVDSPALLAVADAAVLAALCDAAVLVVKPGTSKRRSVQRALERLRAVHVKIIGVVVNAYGRRDRGYYDYAYYNGYYNGAEPDQQDEIAAAKSSSGR